MENINLYKERYNEFTKELLLNYGQDKENVVLSPFSILTLLCMAADSTDTETRDQIINVICKNQNYEDVKGIIKGLAEEFTEGDALAVANALCVNETIRESIKPGFKEKLSEDYNAEMFASKNIVEDVNDWVKEKTKGMIDKIADKSMEKMLACLMNVICFESEWEEPYEEDNIQEMEFNNVDGTTTETDSLFSNEYSYIKSDGFEGFTKPYKNGKYSFMALLPGEEGSEAINQILANISLSEAFDSRVNKEVMVDMPEFKFDFSEDLTRFLENQGMTRVFTPGADFSPMTNEWIQADGIIHKAHIELDRKGTKAAAVTMMVDVLGIPEGLFETPHIYLDRPFIYTVIHNKTGLPVFAGIVNSL